jgi:arylsulfatase/arylsulfatase A
VRWPARLKPQKVARMSGVIDLAPTLLDAAGVKASAKVKFDGQSLMPLLADAKAEWPDRTLYIQVHRGDQPERYRNFCARTEKYKLLHNVPIARPNPDPVRFELYDLSEDPGEKRDLASAQPEVVAKLRNAYDAWFDDVCATRGFAPVRFVVGTKHENPTELQRQDWRGPKTEWNDPDAAGYWEIEVRGGGLYDVECRFPAAAANGTAELKLGAFTAREALSAGAASCRFEGVRLPRGAGRLEVLIQAGSGAVRGAHFVDVHWRGARA